MSSARTRVVLMVVTSHAELGATGKKTGLWLEELATPYYAFTDRGVVVHVASPLGGAAPIDPQSAESKHPSVVRFLADPVARGLAAGTRALDGLDVDAYDAIFVVGGHGVMWDLAEHPLLAALLGGAHDRGKVVAAVCHGPAALVGATDASGASLVKGRRVAGFSNEEEVLAGLDRIVPFALETRLRELGGAYERGPNWGAFAVGDGNLVTGQNPASSGKVAELVLQRLSA